MMSKKMKALIISLNFNPGHVSHMVASYKQCEELGYEATYYVNSEFTAFLPSGSQVLTSDEKCPQAHLAVFLFPSGRNLLNIWKLRRQGTKIAYIFHEPLAAMKEYRKAGFSYKYLIRLWIIDHISALTVKWSDVVLLPSSKALELYKDNPLYRNDNYHYLPLMYDDEFDARHSLTNRKYFSYIGTVAADHAFDSFLDFVVWAVRNRRLPGLKFLIATKSDFEVPEELRNSERVCICKGHPMSDEEINDYYASTFVTWNAYVRTTQSGVLSKSFMFGTPAIVLRKNMNEFVRDGVEVACVDDNTDKEQIAIAVDRIVVDFEAYSKNCRARFLKSFYYKNYNEQFKSFVD